MHRSILKLYWPLVCCLAATLPACSSGTDSSPPAPAATTATAQPASGATAFPVSLRDGLDRSVTLERLPERIVSLSPKNTELLFALGADEQLVGVTSFCDFPAEASELPQVGGFSASSLSMERIVSLRPDLVLSVGDLHEPVIEALERLEIPVVALCAESFDELYREIKLVGQATGHNAQAAQLNAELQGRVDEVRRRVADVPAEERLRVFYQVSDEPLLGAGGSSYLGDMIELAGGVNILDDLEQHYPHVSEEIIVERDPQVILAPSFGSLDEVRQRMGSRPGWDQMEAVQQGRIHFIEHRRVSRCGPRLVDALQEVAATLYPDRFAHEAASGDRDIERRAL